MSILKTFVQHVRMLNLSVKESELTAKHNGIKDYKILSIDKLLSMLDRAEKAKKKKTKKN